MIVETNADDYNLLIDGKGTRQYAVADSPIAPPEILQMLADVASKVRATFTPASWLVVEDSEIVGMVSVTRAPEDRMIDLGYGIAPSRQGRGSATRAIADIVSWANKDPRVDGITAETAVDNLASQAVLIRNGFTQVGKRTDEEDGDLFRWRCMTTGEKPMTVHLYRGPGRVFGFTPDAEGDNLPERFAPWTFFKTTDMQRNQSQPGVEVNTCLDDIERYGFHITDAHTRITDQVISDV